MSKTLNINESLRTQRKEELNIVAQSVKTSCFSAQCFLLEWKDKLPAVGNTWPIHDFNLFFFICLTTPFLFSCGVVKAAVTSVKYWLNFTNKNVQCTNEHFQTKNLSVGQHSIFTWPSWPNKKNSEGNSQCGKFEWPTWMLGKHSQSKVPNFDDSYRK